MLRLLNKLQDILDALRAIDFLGPLVLRLYLTSVFWVAGINMPRSWRGWRLALKSSVIGAVLLVTGLTVHWIAIPLTVTMVVAALVAHWETAGRR